MMDALTAFASTSPWAIWAIAAAATAGVIVRPFSWPEFVWALAGALLLVAPGLLPLRDALDGVLKGTDVYLFLIGMMLLAELARQEGLFDWLAAHAAGHARGSATRLFTLVFGVGTIVTTFLSNDATAVVLTPAVAAVARAVEAKEPLPYLFICAFIANAASFVLPISNPANLVIYGSHMPPLLQWLPRYTLPSVLSIGATYVVLRWTQRVRLREAVSADVDVPNLSAGGKMAAYGIFGTSLVLLMSSGFGIRLGLPTFLAGMVTALLVLARSRCSVMTIVRNISWGVLPLVAGLFVLVEALEKTGLTNRLADELHELALHSASSAAWMAGAVLAVGCNLVNNLPAGLVAGRVVQMANVPDQVRAAVLIGVDLGPNLSVTGSLATILWLTALRREGQHVSAWSFLRLGVLVMPPAFALATAAVSAFG
jgi:arsenical pump membrane protein